MKKMLMITSGLSFEDIGDISFILPELSHTTQFFNINIISLTNKPSSQIKEIDCNEVMVSVRSLSLPKLRGGGESAKSRNSDVQYRVFGRSNGGPLG